MGKTVNGSINSGVTLTAAYNPISVTSTGTIAPLGIGTAVYGNGSQPWQVSNAGRINVSGTVAIELKSGSTVGNSGTINGTVQIQGGAGTVTNAGVIGSASTGVSLLNSGTVGNTGTISGTSNAGVYISGAAGTVTNAGTISSANQSVRLVSGGTVGNSGLITATGTAGFGVDVSGAAGTVTNTGTIGSAFDGVVLFAGGTVGNTGLIAGAGNAGIYVSGGAGTVTDAGTISGGAGAVSFKGSFADRVILDPGAVFKGTVAGGSGTNTLELASGSTAATGTLAAFAGEFVGFDTVAVDAGANWDLASTASIGSGVTLTDAGTLANAGTLNTGVLLQGAGVVDNQAGGVISTTSYYGIQGPGSGTNTVINAGSVSAYFAGIRLVSGLVVNTGTVSGTDGVFTTGASTLANQGLISGFRDGAVLDDGGTVINTGLISGTNFAGVYVLGAAGTVTNAGTISGGASGAVSFKGSFADRVILDPGAVFKGTVAGGSGTNTLELASGSTAATGTLAAFASEFVGFGTIAVDAGASWDLASTASIGSGVTLTDAGTLTNAGTLNTGVLLLGAGVVDNQAGGVVASTGYFGIYRPSGTGSGTNTVINAGTVSAYFAGIELASGLVVNTGTVSGIDPVDITGAGTLTNQGLISGSRNGAVLEDGGTVINTGLISGAKYAGVYVFGAAGTVVNFGTIGGGKEAIQFVGSVANRVELAPGSVMTGTVAGGTGTDTLELMASGSAGTLSAFGTQFTSFERVVLDSGAHWELDGASPAVGTQAVTLSGTGDVLALGAPGSFADGVAGFTALDALDLVGLAYAPGATATLSGSTLTVTSNGVTDMLTLTGIASGTKFAVTQDSAAGSLLQESPACFCRGTLIQTDRGERPVEELAIGDGLVTQSGAVRPLRWIGRRSYGGRFLRRSPNLHPVRLQAGCLGGGLPRRDLLVSPDHAMWLDALLIPARCLVNGATITVERGMAVVDYYHLELDTHDVILAEGAPSESFLDDDSRGLFHNAAEFARLYPDAPNPGRFCAPRVRQGRALEAIRRRLAGVAARRQTG